MKPMEKEAQAAAYAVIGQNHFDAVETIRLALVAARNAKGEECAACAARIKHYYITKTNGLGSEASQASEIISSTIIAMKEE